MAIDAKQIEEALKDYEKCEVFRIKGETGDCVGNDDITFCQEDCEMENCMRNKKNIRDRKIPHSFSVERPEDCPKWI